MDPNGWSFAGMTVNERLFVAGLMGDWDLAIAARDRNAAVQLLEQVNLENAGATVDAVFADPAKYGFGD